MKKLLALIMALCMVVALVAACNTDQPSGGSDPAPGGSDPAPGGSDPAPGGDDDQPAASSDEIDFTLKDVTVKFQLIGWVNPGDAKMAELSANVNKVLADLGKPYTVELYFQEGPPDYDDRTNLMLASGANEFDIIFTSNWAANYRANAASGYLTDLGPYLEEYPEIEEVLTFDFMAASRINGVQYALPTNKEKSRSFGWLLREDIVEAMGMDIAAIEALPHSERTAALEEWFYKAKEEHDLWVWPSFTPCDYQFDRIIEPIIGSRAEPGATTVIAPDLEPEYIASVKLYNKWYNDGILNPDLTRESLVDTEFQTGRYFGAMYQLKPGKDAEMESSLGLDLVQVETVSPQMATAETDGAMLAIPIGSANKVEAFDFISLLYTDANVVNTVIFGEEGINYTMNADGRITIIDAPLSGNGWTMGDQYKNFITDSEDPNKWNEFIAFNEVGVPLPLLGFYPDLSSNDCVTWEAGMRAARERYDDLFKGYVDDVDGGFERLRADYEAAGMNEFIAEIQRQVDEWLATR